MPLVYICCDRCDLRQVTSCTWGLFEYVLDDGVRIPLNRDLGWCEGCAGVAPVEDLSPEPWLLQLREAAAWLARQGEGADVSFWRRWFRRLCRCFRSWKWQELESRVGDAVDALTLLAARQSPARCLRCGDERVIAPLVSAEAQSGFRNGKGPIGREHPGCGGALWRVEGEFRLAVQPMLRSYSPEGGRLAEEAPGSVREHALATEAANRRVRAQRSL